MAMATHRAMQVAGKVVAASTSISGPCALAVFGNAIFYGNVNIDSTLFVPLQVNSTPASQPAANGPEKNDLRNWQPRSPVLAYVGNSDLTVFSTSTSSSCKVSGRHHHLLRCRPVC